MLDRDGVGMKADEVAAVVRSYPLLLTVDAGQARSVVNWLTRRAGLSSKQVCVCVCACLDGEQETAVS